MGVGGSPDVVATLGVAIDSAPLKGGLEQVDAGFAKTGAAADAMAAQVTAAGAALDATAGQVKGVGDAIAPVRTATQGLTTDFEAIAGKATTTRGIFSQMYADFVSGIRETAGPMATWGNAWTALTYNVKSAATSFLGYITGAKGAAGATAEHAAAMEKSGETTKIAVEAVHAAVPALKEMGAAMGSTREITMLLHGGIVVLAAAMTGLLLAAAEKVSQALAQSRQEVQAFTGSAHLTAEVMHEFTETAAKGGVEVATLADSFARLMTNAPQTPSVIKEIQGAVTGLASATQKLGIDTETATKLQGDLAKMLTGSRTQIDAYGNAFTTAGALSVSALRSIVDASPVVGQALAAALGIVAGAGKSATANMIDMADQGRLSADQVLIAFQKLAKFVPEGGNDVTKATQSMKAAWDEFLIALGDTKIVSGTLNLLTEGLKKLAELIKWIKENWEGSWLKSVNDSLRAGFDPSGGVRPTAGNISSAEQAAATGGAITQLNKDIEQTGTDAQATAKASDQLNSSMGGTKGATDALAQSSQAAGAAVAPLGDGVQKTADAAQAATPAVGSFSTALNSLVSALQSAIAAASSAEAAASAGAVGVQLPADVGTNAAGGIYQIGGGGGIDTIPLRGMVSSGEIVAILPQEAASAGLLNQLQSAIGNSPISVTPGGASSAVSIASLASPDAAIAPAASTTIAAPISYAAAERAARSAMGLGAAATATGAVTRIGSPSAGAQVPSGMVLVNGQLYDASVLVQAAHGVAPPPWAGGPGSVGKIEGANSDIGGVLNSHFPSVENPNAGYSGAGSAAATSRAAQSWYAREQAAADKQTALDNAAADAWAKANAPGSAGASGGTYATQEAAARQAAADQARQYFNAVSGGGGAPPLGDAAYGSNPAYDPYAGDLPPDTAYGGVPGYDPYAGDLPPNVAYGPDYGAPASSSFGDYAQPYDANYDSSFSAGGIDTSAYTDFGGLGSDVAFATGGGFTVPFGIGGSGADTVPVRFNASPGESVSIARPDQGPGAGRIGGAAKGKAGHSGDNHFHFYGVQDMDSFSSNRTALSRFAQQAMNS